MQGTDEHDEPFSDLWVRVMADVECQGIWERTGGPGEVDRLPISAALAARVVAWQARYEREYDEGGFDVAGFSREGLDIAKAMKAELPGWTVVYFDEARQRKKRKGQAFEYEIEA